MPAKENNIVQRTLDPENKPHLTVEQEARLNVIAAMPDTHKLITVTLQIYPMPFGYQ